MIDRVIEEMERTFGSDRRRIDHARQVAAHARELLKFIDADPEVTLVAAYLHDIGIHEAERRHGSSAGHHQEIEGPPIARAILTHLGAEAVFIETVCEIVGKHHTPQGIDSPEFRILWDSDALVNLERPLTGKSLEEIEPILDRSLVSEAGYRLGKLIYL